MATYIGTIDLWATGVQDDIASGKLKLQPGQWCRCGNSPMRCRYVGHRGGIMNVVHWQGSPAKTNLHFKMRIDNRRMDRLYVTDKPAYMAEMQKRREARVS